MILLAIDPGPTETAWAFLNDGYLSGLGFGKAPNHEVLAKVLQDAVNYGAQVVIEEVEHYGKDMHAGKTTFETCRWSGRFQQRFLDECTHPNAAMLWHRLPRRLVKQTLLGMGAAKDGDIRTAVIDRLGAPGKKSSPGPTYGVSKDVWQAIGLGLAWLDLNAKGGG